MWNMNGQTVASNQQDTTGTSLGMALSQYFGAPSFTHAVCGRELSCRNIPLRVVDVRANPCVTLWLMPIVIGRSL